MNRFPGNWRVLVTPIESFRFDRKIFIGVEEHGGRITSLVQPMALEACNSALHVDDKPFLEGDPRHVEGFMQAMMNAAWEMGLRPKGLEAPTNELNAVKHHLADMRAIVATKLEVGLKP